MNGRLDQKRHAHRAAIAFGTNMGNRVGYIESALSEMRQAGLKVLSTSPIYETRPMYVKDQDAFLNGVCHVETEKEPLSLLDTLQNIEIKLGRIRDVDKGPRTIDLDIVLYDEEIIQNPRLDVPHKLLHERDFVLRPLFNIMPDAIVNTPAARRTVAELYQDLKIRDKSMSPITELSPNLPLIRPTDSARRTQIMAILNLTPDSFSDGGLHDPYDPVAIRQKVKAFVDAGATIIDIGGQSTRPRAEVVSASTELERILPAIHAIRAMPESQKVAISIDTFYAEVARKAIMAGADIINDVSAGAADPNMLSTVAELGKTIVLMHMRGTPQTMTNLTQYPGGVANVVADELSAYLQAAIKAGIPRWRIILDPGIGFAKKGFQNLDLLYVSKLRQKSTPLRGLPWLVGTSRKAFIGKITGVQDASKRIMGTAAAVTASVAGGADIVRVHDVPEMTEVVKMADAIYRSNGHEDIANE
jgi:2-amino-4-hydroxy-6-hydroxymethyldihydropteridine diphosphokinase / dihydropteroate synthase